MCQRVIYAGSFDPVTYGHIDLIKRAVKIFGEVIVAVAHNPMKKPLFSVKERLDLLRKATAGLDGVIIEDFDGLIIDYCRKQKVTVIIRGLRMISDFEYEFQMALTNRKIAPDIETMFLMPSEDYSYLSSKLLKEIASLGGRLDAFVPDFVQKALVEKFKNK